MLPKALTFVDVETTGLSPVFGRIIEIGIIRVEENRIVDQFQSLINPQTSIDPFIQSMTGITQQDIDNAPSFYKVKNQIKDLLKDTIFVAHNVLFDFMFIKKEFERLEEDFSTKYCCSVKLSKNLYPHFKQHNLDAIIKRFNFSCLNRHRAFDDAKVLWDFYQASLKEWGEKKLIKAFKTAMKRPTLPVSITEEILDSLPQRHGVYIFYNQENAPLYIGKSNNIRERVLSHFANSKMAGVDMRLAQQVSRIEALETAGELGALLLEATLVKKMQPLYNRQLRYAHKLLVIKKEINDKKYHSLSINMLQDVPIESLNQILGIFKSKEELKRFLVSIAKEYNLCPKLLGLEKTNDYCFNYHLKLCFGACSNKEFFVKYNLRFDQAFNSTKIKDWPFKGPIGIKEKSAKEEVFIIDKWCVLGKLKNESERIEDISREYLFDTDTYKILNRYFKKGDFEVCPI